MSAVINDGKYKFKHYDISTAIILDILKIS